MILNDSLFNVFYLSRGRFKDMGGKIVIIEGVGVVVGNVGGDIIIVVISDVLVWIRDIVDDDVGFAIAAVIIVNVTEIVVAG